MFKVLAMLLLMGSVVIGSQASGQTFNKASTIDLLDPGGVTDLDYEMPQETTLNCTEQTELTVTESGGTLKYPILQVGDFTTRSVHSIWDNRPDNSIQIPSLGLDESNGTAVYKTETVYRFKKSQLDPEVPVR